ncbi:MAG: glutamate-1-semialdehyde 2,1-aminomutase, partial [Candidatus Limnocylindrales bacterium]
MTAQTSARGSVSAEWRDRAEDLFPGGVNSPVRAYRAVSGEPPIIMRGEGARVWDADGVEYLDFVGAFGPLILGHAHPRVVAALTRQASRGGPFGATSPAEIELAERIREAMPSMERLRFVSSGTEAVMSALRLARAATSRELIVKFEGGYHGHVDSLLAQAGSGLATLALPASAGVPAAVASGTLLARYNDLDSVRESFAAHGEAIAAVIVEPVAANMGVVPPADGFLEGLRALTRDNGALLIFDEVITGFRVGRGGAQARYGIEPDLTTLGKIIGGGLPVGAYGGRADLMSLIAPSGPVYQAGTLSGHPLAMAAGCATLDLLGPDSYEGLEARSARLEAGLFRTIEEVGAAASVSRVGSLLTLFFRAIAPGDFDEVRDADG